MRAYAGRSHRHIASASYRKIELFMKPSNTNAYEKGKVIRNLLPHAAIFFLENSVFHAVEWLKNMLWAAVTSPSIFPNGFEEKAPKF